MRKMFTRLIVVMILLVVSNAYQANAGPPDNIGNDYTHAVVMPDVDNFVINQVTPDAEVYTYSAPELATEESFYVEIEVNVMVREVTTCRKISTLKALSGSATENAAIALNSACTNLNNVTQSPPLLCSANVAINNSLRRDLQHSNFGYPLTAN
ncbi:hypothetical protein [uncultured Draconibacterium sp.]|uniref:hypothetical protein n=1 Tax=uncultured Draconibacterium sp. TaxID=1573823 RepID=UPI0025E8FF28|nr:hypothetical protein [uncultured Draconibacterium sp.]